MSDSVLQLQVLLGKSGKEGRGSAPGTVDKVPVSASTSLPLVAPKPTKARVGERRNVRDPVGETCVPAVRAALGCAFTDVIAVTPAQMEEAACSRVECPL